MNYTLTISNYFVLLCVVSNHITILLPFLLFLNINLLYAQ